MKFIRQMLAALALCAAIATTAAAARAQQPPVAAKSNLEGKTAVIDSSAFSDDKFGIVRIVNVVKQVDAQFQPQRAELQRLQAQLKALADEIQQTQIVAKPETLAQKSEQAAQLQLQLKRKQEDATAAYQKRMGEVLDPLQQDVGNALTAYAQAHGIMIIIDVSRVPVIYATASVDITKDFIAEYNRTHPATAAAPLGRP
ncbi:MAG: OmpH family outer membrane protein [Pyrinomonadaceae bacterium]